MRIHSGSLSGNTILVLAKTTAPSSEEPSVDFIATTPVATATLNTTTAGTLVKASLSSDFGAFLEISVVGQPGASGDCKLEISADLAVKD